MHSHSPVGPPEVVDVYGDLFCSACDSQARFKVFGGAAPAHENAFCAWCTRKLSDIHESESYEAAGSTHMLVEYPRS